ncbi:MAG TPA: preprotein translocase subunit SecA [Candidatus Limnocylindrales bacterium]|nr:preprotein translocase subunit SecA [Candidatus Limnocylindrales bacterium]
MLERIRKVILGDISTRFIKRLRPIVVRINELEPKIKELSDQELGAQTARFRERLDRGEPLDDMLVEAFATVREAGRRVLNMRHFDVQLIGGLILHAGRIAEMKTGEGKTLVATLPMYTNALLGKGCHLVTVNDYLARRDAEWMGRIYKFLGMSVGIIYHDMDDAERARAYRSDITYGQNNEFGFDYLRDNMKFSVQAFAQRDLHYAIVDEVDSILIDEARTPLIISGPAEQSTEKYYAINRIIPRLKKEEHFTIDEKQRSAMLTDEGVAEVEKILGVPNLYDPSAIEILHHVNQGLRAHALYRRDVDYMVHEGQVVIVDEFTGRLMPGRRWSDGLHQAVEAKEGVNIERENQTLATVTFQNYFRMYRKLAGMTGTAETEAEEFRKIYGLDVIVVPTNRPMIRKDHPDVVYKTQREKYKAVIEEIKDCHERGQPVLVGTISIEKSEMLGEMLKRDGVRHHVLNAKHHAREAEIVAQAGRKGAVTISTNMAGRGTDIVLGGNAEFLARAECMLGEEDAKWAATLERLREQCAAEREEVVAAGGLHILGTERHESRRIDNQLRGRSGRQGDPGSSRFFLSLEDDLLRIFGAERIQGLMKRLGMEDDVPIESRMVSRAVENAQKKVEGHNFDIRKHLLEYDDVMNKQREVIYTRRREYLAAESLRDEALAVAREHAEALPLNYIGDRPRAEWDWKALSDAVFGHFHIHFEIPEEERETIKPEQVVERLTAAVEARYEEREREFGDDIVRQLEKVILLQAIDHHWKDHLLAMDHLKEGIGLRGYGQRNPLQEYQREGFQLFEAMLERFEQDAISKLFSVRVATQEEQAAQREAEAQEEAAPRESAASSAGTSDAPAARQPAPAQPALDRRAAERQLMEARLNQQRLEEQRRRAERQMVLSHGNDRQPAQRPGQTREPDRVGRNDPCPCGSGKKYKKCHGKVA